MLALILCSVSRPSAGETAHILSIDPQPALSPGDIVTFRAELQDPTAPAGFFVWESDRDGVLGVTGDLVFLRDAAGLSRGAHSITLSIETGSGLPSPCGSAPLLIVAPPVARIHFIPGIEGLIRFGPSEDYVPLELHRIEIESDFLEEIRIQGIIYRPLPDSTINGVERPHLAIDRNLDGRAEDDVIGPGGVNDGQFVRFSGLDFPVRAGERLLLRARIARRILRGETFSASLLPLIVALAALLAAAGYAQRRRIHARRCATAIAVSVLLLAIAVKAGCAGDRERSRNLQFTLEDPSDFDAVASDSGLRVEIEGFPAEGILGPRYRVK